MARRKSMLHTRTSSSLAVGSMNNITNSAINIALGSIIQNITMPSPTSEELAEKARTNELEKLTEGVRICIKSLMDQVAQPSSQDGSPYKDLAPFSIADTEIFFGREQAVQTLFRHIERDSLTILHAESGAGKTSLLRAGLMPALILKKRLVVWIRPHKEDPVTSIKDKFLPALNNMPGLKADSLREFLHQICKVFRGRNIIYILIDQFEEFFNLFDKEQRHNFLSELAKCLRDTDLKVKWVLSLRAETLSKLSEMEEFGIQPFSNMFHLQRLTRAEAKKAIEEPALKLNYTFQKNLPEKIIKALETNGEILPAHLQLVCTALLDKLPAGQSQISLDYYDALQGVDGLLRHHLKQQLDLIPDNEQICAHRILEALVTSQTQRIVRTRQELEGELSKFGINPTLINNVLLRLQDRRLLYVQKAPELSDYRYELVHDYLLDEIVLDPATAKRKEAEELLSQGLKYYSKPEHPLLGKDILKLIEKQGHLLFPSELEFELLLRSAIATKRPLEIWIKNTTPDTRRHCISNLQKEKHDPDRTKRNYALLGLWALRSDLSRSLRRDVYKGVFIPKAFLASIAILLSVELIFLLANILLPPASDGNWHTLASLDLEARQSLIVAMDTVNGNWIYAAPENSSRLYISPDGGMTWEPFPMISSEPINLHGITASDDLAYVLSNSDKIWVISPVEKSLKKLATLPTQHPRAIAVNPDNPQQIYVSFYPRGLYRSEDSGKTWTLIKLPDDGGTIQAISVNKSWLLAATQTDILISKDQGKSWRPYGTNIPAQVEGIALYGYEGRFFMALGDKGIMDADASKEGSLLLSIDNFPSAYVYSVAAYGRLPQVRYLPWEGIYVSSDLGIICRREWHWTQKEWLHWQLGKNLPCLPAAGP